MKFYIVIPAHNEEAFILKTLQSLINQTHLPKKLVIVNDHSTDKTKFLVESFSKNIDWISLIDIRSDKDHLPGSKIISAFYKGFETLDQDFDIICKFDADLIFPDNYLETLANHFEAERKLGMVSGFCYIERNNEWILENLTNKDHIRGALKAYRKECFNDIGGLKPSMGWDTVDELLAKFYGWNIKTDATLKVKHLKPTGANYNKGSKLLQGEAMYKMRYGFTITCIASLKLAFKKRSLHLFLDYMHGYFRAKKSKLPFLVSHEQGKFIRNLRWLGIKKRVIS